ncbi:multicopper oxidase domain-containing protein, partial [Acinetobacter baumannii]
GGTKGPILDAGLEPRLKAVSPLAAKTADLAMDLALTGSMQGYTWAIEGALDGGDTLRVKTGQRVDVTMTNKSMMTHPMHLHGHHFQVVAVNG